LQTLPTAGFTKAAFITFDRVQAVIKAVHDTLIHIGDGAPKTLVGGLNPHAGEDGLFGD
jgi:4-hydroxy-L-threonine phosphate dehydrogenase PdxA